ncbi:MAG TPA: hypothetical protein VGS28_03235 [Candidatus Saccharimonadales bacterium]|nr:hypothetical protein [Candidatus Saccharimonadales bacterium]
MTQYHENQPGPDGEPGIESQPGLVGRIVQVNEDTYLIYPPGGGNPEEVSAEELMGADMMYGDGMLGLRLRGIGRAAAGAGDEEEPRPRMTIVNMPGTDEPYL